MTYKSFIFKVLSIVFVVVISGASFIYYIDPLWLFGSSNEYNDVQTVIDERQQKTNFITYQPFDYDTLLIGSSRTTYINQHDFKDMNVYNFAVSNMSVREYNSFIEFAKERRGKEFDTIIIGLDFFKTSLDQSAAPRSLDSYKVKLNERFYRTKSLLSFDSLDYAYTNFKQSRKNEVVEERNYNRENVAVAKKIDSKTIATQTKEKIKKFKDVFYGKTYQYNPDYAIYMQELINNNPNTKFIVFTTPISTQLFEALVEEGRLSDYDRWLKDVTTVFGEVTNFMYPNSVTNDITNYFDGHHFYPPVGTLIAQSLSNDSKANIPADFGVKVTAQNIEEHLAMVHQKAEQLK
ncbi:hypothetical protein [Bacillus massiliigorillae]|uniref:hypothetical protein n=1 Tax=Bacillus massiliigorillae TaxID=1243664 RepID=UPI0003A94857|nr:hypothetical protein [Bacillus massiliigorillae]